MRALVNTNVTIKPKQNAFVTNGQLNTILYGLVINVIINNGNGTYEILVNTDHLSAGWLPMQITITWNLDRRGCLYFLEKAGKEVLRLRCYLMNVERETWK